MWLNMVGEIQVCIHSFNEKGGQNMLFESDDWLALLLFFPEVFTKMT